MAAKKNTNHASLRTTPRGRRPKSAEIENPATDVPAPAEAVLADAGAAPAGPLPPSEAAEAPADKNPFTTFTIEEAGNISDM